MPFEYSPTLYHDGKLWYAGEPSFRVFPMPDGTLIGIFQGNRGDNPHLDFVVRFLPPGRRKRIRTPRNIHWVVDILLNGKNKPEEALKLTKALLRCYENSTAFCSRGERNVFVPRRARRLASQFKHLDSDGGVPVAFVTHIVELFSICEKASPRDNKMFKDVLLKLKAYFEGTKDYYQVLSGARS